MLVPIFFATSKTIVKKDEARAPASGGDFVCSDNLKEETNGKFYPLEAGTMASEMNKICDDTKPFSVTSSVIPGVKGYLFCCLKR